LRKNYAADTQQMSSKLAIDLREEVA